VGESKPARTVACRRQKRGRRPRAGGTRPFSPARRPPRRAPTRSCRTLNTRREFPARPPACVTPTPPLPPCHLPARTCMSGSVHIGCRGGGGLRATAGACSVWHAHTRCRMAPHIHPFPPLPLHGPVPRAASLWQARRGSRARACANRAPRLIRAAPCARTTGALVCRRPASAARSSSRATRTLASSPYPRSRPSTRPSTSVHHTTQLAAPLVAPPRIARHSSLRRRTLWALPDSTWCAAQRYPSPDRVVCPPVVLPQCSRRHPTPMPGPASHTHPRTPLTPGAAPRLQCSHGQTTATPPTSCVYRAKCRSSKH